MDDAERAAELQAHSNEVALHNHRNHAVKSQRKIDGEIVCMACDEPIQVERLRANPAAIRCIDCQSEYEHEERMTWKP